MSRSEALRRYRASLLVFIIGLVFSGLTAFPLLSEMRLLCSVLGISPEAAPDAYAGLRFWIATVHLGLARSYEAFPWLAYGTDWLAFAHIVLAIVFWGPIKDPVKNIWVIQFGLIACVLVIPLALIAGQVRGIPFGWRLIDCSFGVFGLLPLGYALQLTKRLQSADSPHTT